MNHFNQSPEFKRELEKLSKKYRSLPKDLEDFEKFISAYPKGIGKNFVIMHHGLNIYIIKARMTCDYLHNRSMRVIYAYNDNIFEFVYIEIYFKGDKENEDKQRVKDYIAKL